MIPVGFASSLDWVGLVRLTLLLGISVCILGGLLRLIFGKSSAVVKAIFSCIHIALIYLSVIGICAAAPQLRSNLPPLPFASVGSDALQLLDLTSLSAQSFFCAMLQLFILGFLTNLLEDLIPRGSKILTWYLYRFLTACGAYGLYAGICLLVQRYAPDIFGSWAGPILLTVWVLIGLLGLSKGLLTLIAGVFNPLLGLLFAFFFTNLVGKQFTKSILTCLISVGVIYGLYVSGFMGFSFSAFSGAAFTPAFFIGLCCLYLFGKSL